MAKGTLILLFTLTLLLLIGSVYCTYDTVESAKQQASDASGYMKDKAQDIPDAVKKAYDDVTGSVKESAKDSGSWTDYFKSYFGGKASSKKAGHSHAPSSAPVAA